MRFHSPFKWKRTRGRKELLVNWQLSFHFRDIFSSVLFVNNASRQSNALSSNQDADYNQHQILVFENLELFSIVSTSLVN